MMMTILESKSYAGPLHRPRSLSLSLSITLSLLAVAFSPSLSILDFCEFAFCCCYCYWICMTYYIEKGTDRPTIIKTTTMCVCVVVPRISFNLCRVFHFNRLLLFIWRRLSRTEIPICICPGKSGWLHSGCSQGCHGSRGGRVGGNHGNSKRCPSN